MNDIGDLEQYSVVLTITDVAQIINKSVPYAYMLAQRNIFPSVRIGNRIFVAKNQLASFIGVK